VSNLDTQLALDITARLAACGSFVAALEMLAVRNEFGNQGVFSRGAVSALYWGRAGTLTQLDRLIGIVVGVQATSSAVLVLLGPFTLAGRAAAALCLASRSLVRWRRLFGGDGAEQLTTIVLAATVLAALPMPSSTRIDLAVAFIGGQLVLSYMTAGIAKLMSPQWRAGDALPSIMATEIHGHPVAAAMLRRFPRVSAGMGWGVVAFECLFPLSLFGPPWFTLVALSVGLTFHVGCALMMGLNNFLWAFPATYPCVLALRTWVAP
jgi:hypothetical protein